MKCSANTLVSGWRDESSQAPSKGLSEGSCRNTTPLTVALTLAASALRARRQLGRAGDCAQGEELSPPVFGTTVMTENKTNKRKKEQRKRSGNG